MMLVAYAFVAAALAGGGASAAERVLRAAGRQGRWPWLVALALSLLLPALAWNGRGLIDVPPAVSPRCAAPGPGASWLPYAWATLSGLLLLLVACDAVRLRARSRHWIPARAAGVPVRIAARTGPATLGVLRVQSRRITQLEDARVADLRRHAALTVACEHAVQQFEKTAALILADCKTESRH